MAVLLPNCVLTVSRVADREDAFGDRVAGTVGAQSVPYPGNVVERNDGTWSLALDPALWPVREHDLVTDVATGRQWVIQRSSLNTNPRMPEIDFVQAEAVEKGPSGVEPGGSYFVGRTP